MTNYNDVVKNLDHKKLYESHTICTPNYVIEYITQSVLQKITDVQHIKI